MSHKVNIKFGEVNNLSDARYAAACGAEFIGFNFNPEHPQFLDSQKFMEIAGWVEGPQFIAEWDDLPCEYILEETENLGLEYIQLNSFNAETSRNLEGFKIIQNFNLDNCTSIHDIIASVDAVQKHTMYFMLSLSNQEKQEKFLGHEHNKVLADFCRNYPVILNFQWNTNNLLQIVDSYKPFALNLSGSSEEKTGVKDFDQLNEILDLLEI